MNPQRFLPNSSRVKSRYISIQRCEFDESYLGENNNNKRKISFSELQLATQLVTNKKKVREETKRANANVFSPSFLTQAGSLEKN